MTPRASRRTFVLGSASIAACRPPASAPTTAPAIAPAPTDPRAALIDDLAAAERVAGVRYTPAERALAAPLVAEQIARAQSRRARPLPIGLAPACVFDPRLPGRDPAPSRERLRFATARTALPSTDDAIAFASIGEQARWLATRKLTATRLLEIHLDRLSAHAAALACVATPTEALARMQAEAADHEFVRGRVRSPLQGIVWGAKDLLDTAGIPTTWGAEPFAGRVPDADATVVARLHRAGAVLVAKLTTGALAYGDIHDRGVTRNPWNRAEGSSGSSAGPAAATAAGLVGFAIGTETLGSIVSPSMRCGTTGLRPTFGRVPRTGCMPLCWSLDKIGPITRTVDDAMRVLSVIAGPDDRDPAARAAPIDYDADGELAGLRLGIVPRWFGPDAAELDRAALEACRTLGLTIRELEIPTLDEGQLFTQLAAEAAASFEPLTLGDDDDDLRWQGPEAWPNLFRAARFISAIDLVAADRGRRRMMEALDRLFDEVDLILGPSFADPMLLATNATGHPCLVLRTGFVQRAPLPETDGRPPADATPFAAPHGISIWAPLYHEGRLASLGRALERHFDVWHRRPPGL